MKQKFNDNFIADMASSYLFFCYMISVLANYFMDNKFIFIISSLIGLAALLMEFMNKSKDNSYIYLFVGITLLFLLASALIVNRKEGVFVLVINIMANSGIALLLIRRKISKVVGYIPFYSLVLYFLWRIFTYSEIIGNDYSSRNSISIVVIFSCIALYVVSITNDKKIDIFPALIALIISIWAVGRSGIIASSVMLVGLLAFMGHKNKKYYFLIIVVSIFGYLIVDQVFASFVNYIIPDNAINKFATDGLETGRDQIWGHYFNNLNLYTIVFGSDIRVDSYMQDWYYNYHNSYIRLHSFVGLFSFVYIVLILLSSTYLYRRNRILFILFAAALIRMSTDTSNFFTQYDFVPFYFIFIYLANSKNNNKIINIVLPFKRKPICT
jgi:hypothetical protein